MADTLLYDPNSQAVLPITLTDNALCYLKDALAKRGFGSGIRLVVKKTGCSGYTYQVELLDEPSDTDAVFPLADGLNVVVAKIFLDLVKGTCIDYVKEGLNSGFRFANPNQKGVCGCGESFTI